MAVDNSTIANLTGNLTGGTGGGFDLTGALSGALKWGWNALWFLVNTLMGIMRDNPVIGFIIVILLFMAFYYFLTWTQVAAALGMKGFLFIGIVVLLLFLLWYLQGSFNLTGMFSDWLHGSIGMPVNGTNATNGTIEAAKSITEGYTFWK